MLNYERGQYHEQERNEYLVNLFGVKENISRTQYLLSKQVRVQRSGIDTIKYDTIKSVYQHKYENRVYHKMTNFDVKVYPGLILYPVP